MRVLYISHYREPTGVGEAARNYIRALNTTDIDVVCRPVKLNNEQSNLDPTILLCESKDSKNCDVVIQNVLPHLMDYNGLFKKNIAQFVIEGRGMKIHPWYWQIETLDEAWVANTSIEQPNIPTKVIPHAFDVEKYKKDYQPLDIPDIRPTYNFYVVGEWTRRKNIAATICAFHSEFKKSEPVNLVIKTSKFGTSPEELDKQVGEFCRSIKQHLRLYKHVQDYHHEVIITSRLSERDLFRLHKTCHCFVSSSFGEGWCIPAFDAMALGNAVIASNEGGPADYLQSLSGAQLVDGVYEPCFAGEGAFDFLLTANQEWFNVNMNALRKAMRAAYENQQLVNYYANLTKAEEYSYKNVGQLMQTALLK